jgi:hypothetical protein
MAKPKARSSKAQKTRSRTNRSKAAATRVTRTLSGERHVFTIGRDAFGKISAIEGLFLTEEMKHDFQTFDRERLSNEKRRRAIMSKYAGKRSRA